MPYASPCLLSMISFLLCGDGHNNQIWIVASQNEHKWIFHSTGFWQKYFQQEHHSKTHLVDKIHTIIFLLCKQFSINFDHIRDKIYVIDCHHMVSLLEQTTRTLEHQQTIHFLFLGLYLILLFINKKELSTFENGIRHSFFNLWERSKCQIVV